MRILGVIPARGGSRGVPRKNLRQVAGEPLIAHAIRAARESRLLTAFLTTTDDKEIGAVAGACGSPVLRRPRELATDEAPMAAVVLHALECAEREAGVEYEGVVILQPTSPIRTGEDVDGAITLLREDASVDSVISVCPMDDVHPARMYRVDGEAWMRSLWPEWERAQRQDLPVVYYRNGAIYVCRRGLLVRDHVVMGGRRKAYVMPRKRLANIDDERDLAVADVLVRLWREGRL
ncbi:MAG: acylneuraminate cytidylyltransferase family protein [Gemmatimonadetes bacterium]|nr:acylneuraminate cytidylyltransferase family protein [Gemmatimonadota bacterium]